MTLVNISGRTRTAELYEKGFEPGKRYCWYTLSRGPDSGEFSRQVIVNGKGPAGIAGGPDNYASIPAWSAPTAGGIAVVVPANGAVFLTIEKR